MASEIEMFMFGHFGTHGLISLSLLSDRIVLVGAPWDDLTRTSEAVFERAMLLSIWVSPNESCDEFALPWDIIDFASIRQHDDRWKFTLYCSNALELIFLDDFPKSKNSNILD